MSSPSASVYRAQELMVAFSVCDGVIDDCVIEHSKHRPFLEMSPISYGGDKLDARGSVDCQGRIARRYNKTMSLLRSELQIAGLPLPTNRSPHTPLPWQGAGSRIERLRHRHNRALGHRTRTSASSLQSPRNAQFQRSSRAQPTFQIDIQYPNLPAKYSRALRRFLPTSDSRLICDCKSMLHRPASRACEHPSIFTRGVLQPFVVQFERTGKLSVRIA